LSFFAELKRRNVVRVGIAYAIGAWLLLQLTEVLSELLNLPEAVGPVVVAAVAIGLPVALFFAWAYELTPEGVKKEHEVDRGQSITSRTGKKLNFVTLVLLAVAIGYIAYDKFVDTEPEPQMATASEQTPALEPETQPEPARQSIAVLPFSSRSNREEDVFFVEGIHDDLLTTIANIGSLKVISRTSVMEYKDTTKKIPQIARELGVANVLEGGVQRSGNQVRINVQLIDAQTDEHLWAQIFDRELTAENLFAIQSEISQQIADALETTLTDAERERINTMPTDNLDAYDAYVRGRQLMASREAEQLEQATEEFNHAVELDPEFALAWVGVSDSHLLLASYGSLDYSRAQEISASATETAQSIDARLGEAWASQGLRHFYSNEYEDAEAAYLRAIELSPNYATVYHWSAVNLRNYPLRAQEQADFMRKALELDPRSAIIGSALAGIYEDQGLFSRSERQQLKNLELHPGFVPSLSGLGYLYELTGSYDQSMKYYRLAAEQDSEAADLLWNQAWLYFLLGEWQKAEELGEQAEELNPNELGIGFFGIFSNLAQGNDAAAREHMAWVLQRANEESRALPSLAYFELLFGNPEQARELYLLADAGWVDPGQWEALISQHQDIACDVAWTLKQTNDPELSERLVQQTLQYLTQDLPAAIEHADRYSPMVCYLITGETDAFFTAFETTVEHRHPGPWRFIVDRLHWFEPVRHDQRMLDLLDLHDQQIEEQRQLVALLDEEAAL
jgi:TolB-like protein/Tfp pilus assembly protein PilF